MGVATFLGCLSSIDISSFFKSISVGTNMLTESQVGFVQFPLGSVPGRTQIPAACDPHEYTLQYPPSVGYDPTILDVPRWVFEIVSSTFLYSLPPNSASYSPFSLSQGLPLRLHSLGSY